MGVWTKVADAQESKFAPLNTREAMRLVAYWKGRRELREQDWRPVLRLVVNEAPERKRITSRLVATDLLLKMIFGEPQTRPNVKPEVQAVVFDYVARSASILDDRKPDSTPPVIPDRILDMTAKRMVEMLKGKRPAKKGLGALGWLVLLALATRKKK